MNPRSKLAGLLNIQAVKDAAERLHCKRELSPQQVACMEGLCRGLVCKQIANTMGVTADTVRTQVQRARDKLGANTTHHAVALYVRRKRS